MIEDVKGGADDPMESAGPRKRGLGKGLGAILSAHGRVDAHAAQRDELTGLPNRLLLDDRLEEALARCREDNASLAVLAVSLDNFSKVNELFGHRVGDDLLHSTAERLSAARRKMDTVARFAGDEFVVVCPYIGSVALACLVADRILEDVSRPIVVDEAEHRMSASVGIVVVGPGHGEQAPDEGETTEEGAGASVGESAVSPQKTISDAPGAAEPTESAGEDGPAWRGDDTVESLLGDASLAMRHAKEQGGASWKLFEPSMREDAEVRFQSRQDLHTAMEEGGLALYYEPIVDLRSGQTIGECAFPGWGQGESESDDPGDLLDLVDEAGLAAPICRWMMDEALSELHARRDTDDLADRFRMWVKVAPSLSGDPALIEAVDEFTAKHGVPTSMVGIDLREPQVAVMAAVEPILQALEERDVAIAFDDFGMQPSNLALLPSLPISCLKLSPELGASTDADDRALVRGLVDLGRALGLAVVAQGVVSETQVTTLRALGCELAQGTFSVPSAPPEQLWATTPVANEKPAARHLVPVTDGLDDEAEEPADVSGHPSHASLRDVAAATPAPDAGAANTAGRGLVGLPTISVETATSGRTAATETPAARAGESTPIEEADDRDDADDADDADAGRTDDRSPSSGHNGVAGGPDRRDRADTPPADVDIPRPAEREGPLFLV